MAEKKEIIKLDMDEEEKNLKIIKEQIENIENSLKLIKAAEELQKQIVDIEEEALQEINILAVRNFFLEMSNDNMDVFLKKLENITKTYYRKYEPKQK
ncbi:MAG: hypothetical protein ACOCP8_02725 [archaeon]